MAYFKKTSNCKLNHKKWQKDAQFLYRALKIVQILWMRLKICKAEKWNNFFATENWYETNRVLYAFFCYCYSWIDEFLIQVRLENKPIDCVTCEQNQKSD